MANGSRTIFEKIIWVVVICAEHTRTERVAFPEKYHVRTNHFEDCKIGVVIHREYD